MFKRRCRGLRKTSARIRSMHAKVVARASLETVAPADFGSIFSKDSINLRERLGVKTKLAESFDETLVPITDPFGKCYGVADLGLSSQIRDDGLELRTNQGKRKWARRKLAKTATELRGSLLQSIAFDDQGLALSGEVAATLAEVFFCVLDRLPIPFKRIDHRRHLLFGGTAVSLQLRDSGLQRIQRGPVFFRGEILGLPANQDAEIGFELVDQFRRREASEWRSAGVWEPVLGSASFAIFSPSKKKRPASRWGRKRSTASAQFRTQELVVTSIHLDFEIFANAFFQRSPRIGGPDTDVRRCLRALETQVRRRTLRRHQSS